MKERRFRRLHSLESDIAIGLGAVATALIIAAPFCDQSYGLVGNFDPSKLAVPTITDGETQYYTVTAEGREWSWMEYKSDGVSFRRTIKLMQEKDPEKALRLQELYTSLKIYEGFEYLADGEVFSPESGDVFEISDPRVENHGILLQHKPISVMGPNADKSFLYDGMEVKLGEKVEIGEGEEKKTFWEIEVTGGNPQIYNKDLMAKPGEKGFVSQEWFGPKIKPQ